MKSDVCASPDVCALATRPSFYLFSHCHISWNLTEISFPEFDNHLLNLIMNCDRARSQIRGICSFLRVLIVQIFQEFLCTSRTSWAAENLELRVQSCTWKKKIYRGVRKHDCQYIDWTVFLKGAFMVQKPLVMGSLKKGSCWDYACVWIYNATKIQKQATLYSFQILRYCL